MGKKAAGDKMNTINEEHAKALKEIEKTSAEACSLLNTEVKSLRISVKESNKENQKLRSNLEKARTEHDTALAELKFTATTDLDEKLEKISKENAAAIVQLKKRSRCGYVQ